MKDVAEMVTALETRIVDLSNSKIHPQNISAAKLEMMQFIGRLSRTKATFGKSALSRAHRPVSMAQLAR